MMLIQRGVIVFCLTILFGFAPLEGMVSSRIRHYELSEETAYYIPSHPLVSVTLKFPAPIEDLNGAGFALDPEQAGAEYEVAFHPGASYLTVKPIGHSSQDGALQVRNLNVICQGTPYSILMQPVSRASESPTIVFFDKADATRGNYLVKSKRAPKKAIKPTKPTQIIGAMDTMKLLMAMPDEQALKQALRILPNVSFAQGSKEMLDHYGTYQIGVRSVLRLNQHDMLVFAIRITNNGKETLLIDPESFLVRVGDHVYEQVSVDVSPLIAPQQTVEGFVVIIGSPNGAPNYLDPQNEFHISVARIEAMDENDSALRVKNKNSKTSPIDGDDPAWLDPLLASADPNRVIDVQKRVSIDSKATAKKEEAKMKEVAVGEGVQKKEKPLESVLAKATPAVEPTATPNQEPQSTPTPKPAPKVEVIAPSLLTKAKTIAPVFKQEQSDSQDKMVLQVGATKQYDQHTEITLNEEAK